MIWGSLPKSGFSAQWSSVRQHLQGETKKAALPEVEMPDVTPTAQNVAKLERAIERYIGRIGSGEVEDFAQIIDQNLNLADELRSFLNQDAWMRRDSGNVRRERVPDHVRFGRGNDQAYTFQRSLSTGSTGCKHVSKSTFGEYELLSELGRGGMGVEFKARQSAVNRIVELKMIRSAQLASRQDVQRCYTEAESAARLEHPGHAEIVPVFAAGEIDGCHFYSMGFEEGISFQEYLTEEHVLSARESAELVHRVAEAIHTAHRRGVTHRDLKPANIMLALSNKDDALHVTARGLWIEPKVTDFGLAKKAETDSNLTGTGQILGAPSYMPPEQAFGESSVRSDVYSLGAVLYCLLVGRPQFRAENAIQTLQQVLHDEPVPLRQINSAVPRDLETICSKCLQKNPARRYSSAQELPSDLKRFGAGEPIKARSVGNLEHAITWGRRHPARAGLIVAGVFSLMAFAGLVVGHRYQGQLQQLLSSHLVLSAHAAWRDNELVTCVAFSPNGNRIASTSWDGSVKVWHPGLFQENLSLKGRGGRAYALAFSPDVRFVASAHHDGTITL